jgi:DNA polymerase IV
MIACFTLPQFAVAVERARLTHLWGEPVALLDAEDKVITASDEAVPYGIRPGLSASAARTFCPALITLPYDREAYMEAAEAVWRVLAIESSVVEPVSPEVCYIEVGARDALSNVRYLASAIASRISVPIYVGLASSKVVAYRAAMQDKKNEVVIVPLGREAAFLSGLGIEKVPHIDFKTRQKLDRLGVKTLGDVLALPGHELRRQLPKIGFLLQRLATGEDGDPVRPLYPPRSLDHTFAFEDEIEDETSVHYALRDCARHIAAALTDKREFCRSIALTVEQADRTYQQEAEKLASPIAGEEEIYCASLRLFSRMVLTSPILEIYLTVSHLGAGSGLQLALLDDNFHGQGLPHERRARLAEVLALLRKRFGVGSILPLSMLRQARRIGLWTYSLTHGFDEPVRVATDAQEAPVRYWLTGRRARREGHGPREVRRILNRWKETKWFWGAASTQVVYRVETDPAGLSELRKLSVEWRLSGVHD